MANASVRIFRALHMIQRPRLRTFFVFASIPAIMFTCWLQNASRFGWTAACEWHSAIPIAGYSFALDRYRSWLINNAFQQCAAPRFATLELEQANTQWFQSQTHRDVFVVTSGDQQNVRANVVVQVHAPLFNHRATQSELKDYTDNVSDKLHMLWHPGLEVK